jgi:ankyrin repeat protein
VDFGLIRESLKSSPNLENGAGERAMKRNSQLAVHFVAQNGHEANVRLLLNNGAVKEQGDKHGDVPLVISALNSRGSAVRPLIERSVNMGKCFPQSLEAI